MATKKKEAATSLKSALAEMTAPDQERQIVSESNSAAYLRTFEFDQLKFDYDQVAEPVRAKVKDAAVEINQRRRRSMDDVITIGFRLAEVQEVLGSQFEKWCAAEFDYSHATAMDFIKIYERFGHDRSRLEGIGISVARLLASPSVPDEAVNYVIDHSHAGDPLKYEEAKAVVDEFRPDEFKRTSRRKERIPRVVSGEYTVESDHPANTPEEIVRTLLEAPDNTALLPAAIQRATLEELQEAVEQLPADDTTRRPVLEHAIDNYSRSHVENGEPLQLPMAIGKKLTGRMSLDLPRKTWAKLADALEAFDLSPHLSVDESVSLLTLIRKHL